jgi:6-pyruvoyltetrahydropterin/6-carboxytetrahydropterin synthase
LQERLRLLAAGLHYQLLNDLPAFAGRNPTVEVVADHCWQELADGLRDEGLNLLTVRLWENPQAYAARSGAL